MTTLEKLNMNVKQVNSDFQAIKNKIVEKGIDVADGTRTAEYAAKIDNVYEAGKKSQYDEFWDAFQENGNRTTYAKGFTGVGWNDATFYPKYDIKVVGSGNDFMPSNRVTDISARLKECNVSLDLSECTSLSWGMSTLWSRTLPILNVAKVTNFNSCFYGANYLVTIEKIILNNNGDQLLTNAFYDCRALENLTIEGTIGQNGFNVQWSTKLSKASITSIINALSTTTSGLTVTLSENAVNKAFETSEGTNDGSTSAEWLALRATKNNWTISLIGGA